MANPGPADNDVARIGNEQETVALRSYREPIIGPERASWAIVDALGEAGLADGHRAVADARHFRCPVCWLRRTCIHTRVANYRSSGHAQGPALKVRIGRAGGCRWRSTRS